MASFEDSGWGIERRTTYQDRRIQRRWQIATGIAVAISCAFVIAAIWEYRAQATREPSIQVIKQNVRSVSEPAAKSADEVRRQELQRAALEQQARKQRAEQERAEKEAVRAANQKRESEQRGSEQRAEQQRAPEAAMPLEDEKTRKERAWAKFYKRPAHCDDPASDHAIQCANDFIRAQRQFHEAYSTGKL
jgi:type IV secretory pathway VirB10-like protein